MIRSPLAAVTVGAPPTEAATTTPTASAALATPRKLEKRDARDRALALERKGSHDRLPLRSQAVRAGNVSVGVFSVVYERVEDAVGPIMAIENVSRLLAKSPRPRSESGVATPLQFSSTADA